MRLQSPIDPAVYRGQPALIPIIAALGRELEYFDPESVILDLLLEQEQTTWGIGELVYEIGSTSAVAEALDALQDAHLVECSGAFVRIARA